MLVMRQLHGDYDTFRGYINVCGGDLPGSPLQLLSKAFLITLTVISVIEEGDMWRVRGRDVGRQGREPGFPPKERRENASARCGFWVQKDPIYVSHRVSQGLYEILSMREAGIVATG
ncbi:hypothetical protein GOODEAATRI_034396 [Goodea atripinnis]|uniref:Uncharacterized protein n=1 Tax=Goodea atripinnis TaxID=208336 RepID=A0ABV0PU00_9TELE